MTSIGLNLSWLQPGRVGGTEVYAARLLDALSARPDLSPHVFAGPAALHAHRDRLTGTACHVMPRAADRRAGRLIAERVWLARAMARAGVEVAHHMGGTVPPGFDGPTVVTIHDLQPLDDPANFDVVKRTWLARALPAAVRRADVITTPSSWVGERIIERFDVERARVQTVSAYAADPEVGTEAPTAAVGELVDRGPVVLYPAMTMRHKNHRMLFRAFAEATSRRPDLQLVCVGAVGRDHDEIAAAASALSPRIHMLGHVAATDLGALFAAAELVVFPSLYEGFGLPVLEAQRARVPVAVSTTSALPEVAGAGALLIDPDDIDAWIDVLAAPLDSPTRLRLVESGVANQRRFTPTAMAQAQVQAYRLAARFSAAS